MAPNNALRQKDPEPENEGASLVPAEQIAARGVGTDEDLDDALISEFATAKWTAFGELRSFFTAWTFVTRLPGPAWTDHHPGYLMRGMAWFPACGALIGGWTAVWFDAAASLLPAPVAAIGSTAAGLWLTGCFHEDGLADTTDGFGGGWTRQQIRKIMTDTRLGTYGGAALTLYLAAKCTLLGQLSDSVWAWGACRGAGPALIAAHTIGRATSASLIKQHEYLVDDGDAKGGFYSWMTRSREVLTWPRVAFAALTGGAVGSLLYGPRCGGGMAACVIGGSTFLAGEYGEYVLGGVMGDFLGATICVTEVSVYAALLGMHQGLRFELTKGPLSRLALTLGAVHLWCQFVARKNLWPAEDAERAERQEAETVTAGEEEKEGGVTYQQAMDVVDAKAKPKGSLVGVGGC